MSTKHYLKQTDLILVRRSVTGNLADDAWSSVVMSVNDAINGEQWDTTRGSMSVFVTIHDKNMILDRYITYGNLGDDTVYQSKKSAYIYLIEPYEIENYDIQLESMKKHMIEMEQLDAKRND